MKWLIYLLFPVCFVLLVLLFRKNFEVDCNKYYLTKIKPVHFEGKVINKYRDQNHAYPRIVIQNHEKKIITLFDFDTSGLYSYIDKEDQLYKSKGSLKFVVSRKKEDNVIDLKYFYVGCEY